MILFPGSRDYQQLEVGWLLSLADGCSGAGRALNNAAYTHNVWCNLIWGCSDDWCYDKVVANSMDA